MLRLYRRGGGRHSINPVDCRLHSAKQESLIALICTTINQFNKKDMAKSVLDGTDLILSIGGNALGFSTGCKVSTSAETGERVTKEASGGKWKESYIKSFSEQITADGVVLTDGTAEVPSYDQLKDAMLKGEPVDGAYNLRDGDKRTGKASGGYKGKYLITSLDLDGQAGDDAKYSITLQNSGAVTKADSGLSGGNSVSPRG